MSLAFTFSSAILLCVLVSGENSGQGTSSDSEMQNSTAHALLRRICTAMSLEASAEERLTFVFVVRAKFGTVFNYLWELPRAQVYLSRMDFVLKPNDREIVISWERETMTFSVHRRKFWDLGSFIGYRCVLQHCFKGKFNLERRFLVQIREWSKEDAPENPLAVLQRMLSKGTNNYLQGFRRTFIIVRMEKKARVHSMITVRRTGEIIGGHILKMTAGVFEMRHVRSMFVDFITSRNDSDEFNLNFDAASFATGKKTAKIHFNTCFSYDKAYVHAFEYLTVRLAVPLPWETRLVSNLPKYLSLEVPLTLLSLFVLPTLLSTRRYRTFSPVSETWGTAYHLLSGDDRNSLIDPVKQGTLMLVVGGLISLMILYPINLLKGEVVSSPYEQRIQPSTCMVELCYFSSFRPFWFRDDLSQNIIGRLEGKSDLGEAISKDSLKEECEPVSYSSTGMMNWTAIALLAQYLTVCDDPILMKLQLMQWERELAFELITGAHATQAMCSSFESFDGQVDIWKHYRLTQRILAHSLLHYPHVKSSLYGEKNYFDLGFWSRTKKSATDRWANTAHIKPKIVRAIDALKKKYTRYKMLDRGSAFASITLGGLEEMFFAFFGCLTLILLQAVIECLSNTPYYVRFRQRINH